MYPLPKSITFDCPQCTRTIRATMPNQAPSTLEIDSIGRVSFTVTRLTQTATDHSTACSYRAL